MRQTVEWGMHAFRSSFPRICDKIRYEENGRRYEFILLLLLVYNYRANKVGINQIKTTYMSEFAQGFFQADDEDIHLREAIWRRESGETPPGRQTRRR